MAIKHQQLTFLGPQQCTQIWIFGMQNANIPSSNPGGLSRYPTLNLKMETIFFTSEITLRFENTGIVFPEGLIQFLKINLLFEICPQAVPPLCGA
jgi:hypothetical protein